MLGFDPLHIATAGKLVALVSPADAERILAARRHTRYGQDAVLIGHLKSVGKAGVRLNTGISGTRLFEPLPGQMLPRIC